MKLGGSKARALLGGVAVIAILGVVGERGRSRPRERGTTAERSKTESARPHGVRPAAAILQNTPLSLAGDLAAQHYRTIAIQRYQLAVWNACGRGREGPGRSRRGRSCCCGPGARVHASLVTTRLRTTPVRFPPTASTATRWRASAPTSPTRPVGTRRSTRARAQAVPTRHCPSTWDGYAGYARAQDAPPEIQDQWAREAIAAAGTRPWAGSGC